MNVLTKAAVQGAACGLMIGAVLLVGGRVWRPATVAAQAPAVAKVVRAQSFEVVDAAGRRRASLGMLSDGSSALDLFDAAGKARAFLSVNSDGSPGLGLYDAGGKTRAALGTTSLEVVKTGEERTRSESSLVLFGTDGKVIWQAP